MSYDVDIVYPACPLCERGEYRVEGIGFGPTFNYRPMFAAAFQCEEGLRILNGLTGKQAAHILEVTIQRMRDNPDEMRRHNPPNGWGRYDEELLRRMAEFKDQCADHPTATVRIGDLPWFLKEGNEEAAG